MTEQLDVTAVKLYFQSLQDTICDALAAVDGADGFSEDVWQHANGGSEEQRLYDEYLPVRDWLSLEK